MLRRAASCAPGLCRWQLVKCVRHQVLEPLGASRRGEACFAKSVFLQLVPPALPGSPCSSTSCSVLLLAERDFMTPTGHPGEGSPSPPPSPDDLEAASSKYKRRRRGGNGPGSRLVRVLRLGPGGIALSAAWAAVGIALGMLLSALGSLAISRLASTAPLDAVLLPGQYKQAHPAAAGTGAANCTVSLASADHALLRREMDGFVHSLCDKRPWLGAAADATPAEAQGGVVTAGQEAAVQGLSTVPRLVDEAFGKQSSSNVPGVGLCSCLAKVPTAS